MDESTPRRRVATLIKNTWNEVNAGIQAIFMLMWIVGSALVLLGILGDSRGWWASKPFLTNIFSALISALFGIPFVLLVLQRVTAHQAAMLEQKQVRRLAARAGQQFADAARQMLGDGSADHIEMLNRAEVALDKVEETATATLEAGVGRRAFDTLPESAEPMIQAWELWQQTFGSPVKERKNWSEVLAAWDFLSHHVRARLLEVGATWLPAEDVRTIDSILNKNVPKELNVIAIGITDYLSAAQQVGKTGGKVRRAFEHQVIDLPLSSSLRSKINELSSYSRDDSRYWEYLENLSNQAAQTRRSLSDLRSLLKRAEAVSSTLSIPDL